jgi:hypothetical protein
MMRKTFLALTVASLALPSFAGDVITAGKLARDAKDYYGQTVTVMAEVEEVFDANTFSLDEDSILAGADVLVLMPGGTPMKLTPNQKVTVTGKVRPYVVAELDRDFDFFKGGKIVSTSKKIDLDQRPVLVATHVNVSDAAAHSHKH